MGVLPKATSTPDFVSLGSRPVGGGWPETESQSLLVQPCGSTSLRTALPRGTLGEGGQGLRAPGPRVGSRPGREALSAAGCRGCWDRDPETQRFRQGGWTVPPWRPEGRLESCKAKPEGQQGCGPAEGCHEADSRVLRPPTASPASLVTSTSCGSLLLLLRPLWSPNLGSLRSLP